MLEGKKVLLYGRNIDDLKSILPDSLTLVDANPDYVITYGGDGSLLGAERDWPGVPKIALRDYHNNPKCPQHSEKQVLELALKGELKSQKLIKLEAFTESGESLCAINDIALHNGDPRSAIRYVVSIDGKFFPHQIVGDGVVVSTPFGSSAYYKSITGSVFYTGIGVAFNNSTEPMDHIVLSDEAVIEVTVTRGPAILLADNSPQHFLINEGEKILVKKTATDVVFYGVDIFRCPDCYALKRKMWKENLSSIMANK